VTRGEAWFSHGTTALVGGTGVIYGWMRYLAEPTDEFALVNHPRQPDLQGLHILFAPWLVFAVALLWRNHIWGRVRSGFRPRRKGGLSLLAIFFPMVASGYLLQTTADQAWLRAWVVVHVATSCLWILTYVAHQLSPRSRGSTGPSNDSTVSSSRRA